MPIIRAENIGHAYDSKNYVLKDISILLEAGNALAVTGVSGSGKTTLLNILALLMHPTCGEYTFLDANASKLSESARAQMRLKNIGLIRQDLALLPDRSALENVMVPLLLMGKAKKKEMLDRGKEALDCVGILQQADARIGKLSGGQRQRVAIARALVTKPKLILADEPTAQLDADNARAVVELLRKVTRSDATLILSTHDLSLLSSFEKRLNLGKGES